MILSQCYNKLSIFQEAPPVVPQEVAGNHLDRKSFGLTKLLTTFKTDTQTGNGLSYYINGSQTFLSLVLETHFLFWSQKRQNGFCPPPPERWGFVPALIPVKQGDQVASVTGGACCFRWVSRLRTYRDREGVAVGNVTNVVCIIGNRVIILWLRFGKQNQIKQYDSAFLILSPTCKSTVS